MTIDALNIPPTILVVHSREKRRKCTVEPLRKQPGFAFWKYPRQGSQPLLGYVRLGLGGTLLTREEPNPGLLLLDGTWKLAERMERQYSALPVRSLDPAWRTAYPRTSKVAEDPTAGMATIEALYAAYVQLGRSTSGILDAFHWREEFLQMNAAVLEKYGRSSNYASRGRH